MSLPLGIQDLAPIGDDLDRCYTPQPLVDTIIDMLDSYEWWGWEDMGWDEPDGDTLPPKRILEPSVGGGGFVRGVRKRWRAAEVIGVDIDPRAAGLDLCDVAIRGDLLTADLPPCDLVIGNPPFSGPTAIAHVQRCLAVPGAVVALILPWSFLGGVERWSFLHQTPPQFVTPITPRPWGDRVRETALYVWHRPDERRPELPRVDRPLVWR